MREATGRQTIAPDPDGARRVGAVPEAWRSVDQVPDAPPEPPAAARRAPAAALVLLALGLAACAIALLTSSPAPEVDVSAAAPGDLAPSASGAASSAANWLVDVGGAVARPGMYALPPGSRVSDAIRAAGGYGPRIDADAAAASLNLAEVLHDGAKIVVPERGTRAAAAGATGGSTSGGPGSGSGLIDLNRATSSELDTLPGVGPVTAAKIIAAREERPFASVDDLLSRKVVSASVLSKIRPLVTAGG